MRKDAADFIKLAFKIPFRQVWDRFVQRKASNWSNKTGPLDARYPESYFTLIGLRKSICSVWMRDQRQHAADERRQQSGALGAWK